MFFMVRSIPNYYLLMQILFSTVFYDDFLFFNNYAIIVDMNTITQILPWIQIILSIILIFLILIQRGSDGIEGLGGGSSNITYFSRRGSEKFIFVSTIVVAVLFAVSAILPLIFG